MLIYWTLLADEVGSSAGQKGGESFQFSQTSSFTTRTHGDTPCHRNKHCWSHFIQSCLLMCASGHRDSDYIHRFKLFYRASAFSQALLCGVAVSRTRNRAHTRAGSKPCPHCEHHGTKFTGVTSAQWVIAAGICSWSRQDIVRGLSVPQKFPTGGANNYAQFVNTCNLCKM